MDEAVVHVKLDNERSYPIQFATIQELPEFLSTSGIRKGKYIIVTDTNVASHYLNPVRDILSGSGWDDLIEILIDPGESSKSPEPLQRIYNEALRSGIDRKTPLFALGGGVIGDLAGYAAATLLRGLPLVHIPTSLMAQVDSSIGGKTGINHPLGKNLIGAFHQPTLVLSDMNLLQSLPELEWVSGLAEVVKHGLIADANFVDELSKNWDHILQREKQSTQRTIMRAAEIKALVVSEDERETSRRAILNFGHTFAHAIERVAGYGQFTHGEAVALGMRAATKVSALINPDLPYAFIDSFLRRLPVRNSIHHLDPGVLTDAMYYDKKVQEGNLHLILLREIGHAYTTSEITEEQILTGWNYLMDL
ncbi:MAG: 3-dehydroquinate synthase [Bacteroidetes bacterium]|nr:3-dehydroquinate synthase [Bacteroidota bacterium]MCY4206114.1 3-dehydroquinate synthase [Bacteroidota bacterium]